MRGVAAVRSGRSASGLYPWHSSALIGCDNFGHYCHALHGVSWRRLGEACDGRANLLSRRISHSHAGGPRVPARHEQYRYMRQLGGLAWCTPTTAVRLPELLSDIVTPFRWRARENRLRFHPDKEFVRYIVAGIFEGFRIGFDYGFRSSLRWCSRNMRSAYDHPDVVSSYLGGESLHRSAALGSSPSVTSQISGGLFLTCPAPAGEASMTGSLATCAPSRTFRWQTSHY